MAEYQMSVTMQTDLIAMIIESSYEMADATTILVVEDNRDTLELIGRMLEATDYRIILTNHAYDALDELAEQSVTLLLIDINLPRVSGFQLLQQIRENEQWAQIPAIAITANAIRASRSECLKAGFDEHLTKPITRAELLDLIAVVLAM